MAKGKRTAYWKVVFCEDISTRKPYGTSLERKETVLVDKTLIVDKSTTLSEVQRISDDDTKFDTEDKWQLATNAWRSYVKFDSDFYDNSKTSYMKFMCGWIKEEEPLHMEWPNFRTYISDKLRKAAGHLESSAKTVDNMDDMTCFDRENCLKALDIILELPESAIASVRKSLQEDLERKPQFENQEGEAA